MTPEGTAQKLLKATSQESYVNSSTNFKVLSIYMTSWLWYTTQYGFFTPLSKKLYILSTTVSYWKMRHY